MADDFTIPCRWDGAAFVPLGNNAARVAERYRPGERVEVIADHGRSDKSHDHFFAVLRELWRTIPDSMMDAPWAHSVDTLRAHALIRTGYSTLNVIPVGTAKGAARVAVALRGIQGPYNIITPAGSVVNHFTARSQSYKAMPDGEFQRSKVAVLDWIEATLAGVPDQRGSAT